MEQELLTPKDKRSSRWGKKPTNEERASVDQQKKDMRLMAADLLLQFRNDVKQKKLDPQQRIQLFKTIAPFLGYTDDENKSSEDIGMDTLAEKYLQIEARVKTVSRKPSSKGEGKE